MQNGAPPSDDGARTRLAEALAQTAQRDQRAFARLYALTSAKLFGICLRICGERKAAEDVLQEVYLSIWLRSGRYEAGRGSVIAWLAAIARNRAIDWRRSNPERVTQSVDAVSTIADERPEADSLLLLDERERRLHACLDELEPRQRAAIRSAFFDGHTYAELALREGVPLGTMKSWVRRGLMQMRKALDDDA